MLKSFYGVLHHFTPTPTRTNKSEPVFACFQYDPPIGFGPDEISLMIWKVFLSISLFFVLLLLFNTRGSTNALLPPAIEGNAVELH